MTVYSYSQLEQLWEQAGGSSAMAPIMAAIAEAESSGNSDAYNSSGATGLWQILGAVDASDQGSLTNPQINAKEAVLKYNTQGLGAWVTYTSGAYKQFLQGNNIASPVSSPIPGVSSTSALNNITANSGSSVVSTGVSAISGASTLFHDAARFLNFFFQWFQPGQGWRAAMGVTGVVSAGVGVKSYQSSVSSNSGSALPLSILSSGLALMCFYMAFRPWPLSNSKPIRPAAYVTDIFKGTPPQQGPAPTDDTDAIEVGLVTFAGIWASAKIASSLANLANDAASIGNALGGNSASSASESESNAESDEASAGEGWEAEAGTILGDLAEVA